MRLSYLSLVTGTLALVATGCLGNLYSVDRDELYRLSRLPQDRRGENVRSVQQFKSRRAPPRYAGGGGGVHVGVGVVVVGSAGHSHGHHRRHRNPPTPTASKQATGAAVIVAAAGTMVALAFSEGSRWDGWVRVHPEHPLHLYGPGGQYLAIPLAALTPEHADWAEEGLLVENEGPVFEQTRRAPLDRTGFTYGVDLGAGGVATAAENYAPIGFLGHLQFGGFPWNEFGILGTIGLGWADDREGDALFNTRLALELHYYPIAFGLARPGIFVMAGDLFHDEDTDAGQRSGHRFLAGGGLLMQFEITTRLAITLRGGLAATGSDDGTLTVPEVSLGMSVY